jgi:NADH-quinone oxidoreductase subunit E
MAGPNQHVAKDAPTASADAAAASGYGSDPFGMAGWMKDMPVHPLMRHPVAAMATAGAIGVGITSHMAGLMFGAMQGLAETALKAGMAGEGHAPKPMTAPQEAARAPAASLARTSVRSPAKTGVKRSKAAVRVVEVPADDLKRISGIGPKLQQVLNGLGIRRYADIAAWSKAEMRRFDEQLGLSGRIERDGWVEQARALAKG